MADATTTVDFPEFTGEWRGPIPVPSIDSEAFWAGLREGELRILHCARCGHWTHPPLAPCPACHSPELAAEAVSGRGFVYSYTIAHREFAPGIEPPYVVAVVELDEQPGLRILTNLVNVNQADVAIGLKVRALFRDVADDAALVFFEPEA
jgi:uncharacterized OB-fold protein